jgi:hypothetical protein
LPISWFKPVFVETALGLMASGPLQGAFCLGAAVDQTVGRGLFLRLTPLDAFARSAEIHEVAHAKLGGTGVYGGHPGLRGSGISYVDQLSADHDQAAPRGLGSNAAVENCRDNCSIGQDTITGGKEYRQQLQVSQTKSVEVYKVTFD